MTNVLTICSNDTYSNSCQVKTARTVHDQKLDRWGARTMSHSTNEVPYDKRLAKKKKFTKQKAPFVPVLNDARILDTGVEKEQYIRVSLVHAFKNF
jgi:hypothetical protein